ncbi:MAG TPA: hypothetical protein VF849_00095 [Blattabacteriaceae bacterium]
MKSLKNKQDKILNKLNQNPTRKTYWKILHKIEKEIKKKRL